LWARIVTAPFPHLAARLLDQPGARQRNPELAERADKLALPAPVAVALGASLALVAAAAAKRGPQLLLHQRLDEAANRQADRLLERVEPILTGKWIQGLGCCNMLHGVSSFRRPQAAEFEVSQPGAYASFSILHQPCDTTGASKVRRLILLLVS
jgi:hypothetical protein